jgi:hypothetical protein
MQLPGRRGRKAHPNAGVWGHRKMLAEVSD